MERGLIQIQDTLGQCSPGVWSIGDSRKYDLEAQHDFNPELYSDNHPFNLSPELLHTQLPVSEEAPLDPKLDEIHPFVPALSAMKGDTNKRMEEVYKKFQS